MIRSMSYGRNPDVTLRDAERLFEQSQTLQSFEVYRRIATRSGQTLHPITVGYTYAQLLHEALLNRIFAVDFDATNYSLYPESQRHLLNLEISLMTDEEASVHRGFLPYSPTSDRFDILHLRLDTQANRFSIQMVNNNPIPVSCLNLVPELTRLLMEVGWTDAGNIDFWAELRANPDDRFSAVQRASRYGDRNSLAELLQQRLRVGILTPWHVRVASYLGHRAAQEVIWENALDWTNQHQRFMGYEAMLHLDTFLTIQIMLEYVESLLITEEFVYLNEIQPFAEALQSARRILIGEALDLDTSIQLHRLNSRCLRFHAIYMAGGTGFSEALARGIKEPDKLASIVADVGKIMRMVVELSFEADRNRRYRMAGICSTIQPYPTNRKSYRQQAMFIADRILGLVPVA